MFLVLVRHVELVTDQMSLHTRVTMNVYVILVFLGTLLLILVIVGQKYFSIHHALLVEVVLKITVQ